MVNLRGDGSFVSGVAERWSADARSATFTLRPDVTCSDGTPLKASQVAADIRFNNDPKNKSLLYGSSVPAVPLTVTSDDATRTVKVVSEKQPYALLLHTVGQMPILCPKGLSDPSVLKTASDGTGPFALTGYVPGQSFTYRVRKEYAWGPGGGKTDVPGMPDHVVLKVVPNETTAANLLASGAVNMASVAGADRARLDARGLKSVDTNSAGTWLRFNQLQSSRATSDKRVRRALVQALNLDEVVKVSTGGQGHAAKGLLALDPQSCPGDTMAGQVPALDVSGAEKSLDEAGWLKAADGVRKRNGKPLALDLHYIPTTSPYEASAAELMAEKWRQIGVQVKLVSDTLITYTDVMYKTGNWDLYLANVSASLPTMLIPSLSGAVPPNGRNGSGIVNKAYTANTVKAMSMTMPAACQYWQQAERALWSDVNILPISILPARYYLNGAQARLNGVQRPVPLSLRLLK